MATPAWGLAAQLAETMGARYLPLTELSAGAMTSAIREGLRSELRRVRVVGLGPQQTKTGFSAGKARTEPTRGHAPGNGDLNQLPNRLCASAARSMRA